MKTGSALSTLALIASTSAQYGGDLGIFFQIQASSVSSTYQPSFRGNLLTGFHAGAGQDEIVATADPDYAATFTIENGALVLNSSYPYPVTLGNSHPYLSDAPAGYKVLSANAGDPNAPGVTKPFSYNPSTSEITLEQPDIAFVLCNVNATAPFPSAGPQTQLLWRTTTESSPDTRSPPKCADVVLHAVQVLRK